MGDLLASITGLRQEPIPVENLCAASKIFDKLILQGINQIEPEDKVDLNGEHLHGFKRSRSTDFTNANSISPFQSSRSGQFRPHGKLEFKLSV